MELADRWGIPEWELEERTTYSQLMRRIVYDNRIKVSENDILSANICHTMVCCAPIKGKRPAYKDFLPRRRVRKSQMSADEIKHVMMNAFRGLGGGKTQGT